MTKTDLVIVVVFLVLMVGIWGLASYQIHQSRAELEKIDEFCQTISDDCPPVP